MASLSSLRLTRFPLDLLKIASYSSIPCHITFNENYKPLVPKTHRSGLSGIVQLVLDHPLVLEAVVVLLLFHSSLSVFFVDSIHPLVGKPGHVKHSLVALLREDVLLLVRLSLQRCYA